MPHLPTHVVQEDGLLSQHSKDVLAKKRLDDLRIRLEKEKGKKKPLGPVAVPTPTDVPLPGERVGPPPIPVPAPTPRILQPDMGPPESFAPNPVPLLPGNAPAGVRPIPLDPSFRVGTTSPAEWARIAPFPHLPQWGSVEDTVAPFLRLFPLLQRNRPYVQILEEINAMLSSPYGREYVLVGLRKRLDEGGADTPDDVTAVLGGLGWDGASIATFISGGLAAPSPVDKPGGGLFSPPPVPPTQLQVANALHSVIPTLALKPDAYTDENEYASAVLSTFESQLSTEEGQDAFLNDVFSKGRNADTEFILDLMGWTSPQIDSFFTGAPPGEGSEIEGILRRIFPDRDLDSVLSWATDENPTVQETFWEEVRSRGVTTDTWALVKKAFPDLPTDQRVSFFSASTQPSNEFLSAIGDKLSGAMQFADGWYRTGIMELGFAFQNAGAPLRALLNHEDAPVSEAERLMNKAFMEHGWKAIFSSDVNKAWDIYLSGHKFIKFWAEMSNPLYFLPWGGTAGFLARPFLKVPLLGPTMQGIAKTVQFAELAPFRAVAGVTKAGFSGVGRLGLEAEKLLAQHAPRGIGGGAGRTEQFLLRELPTPQFLKHSMFTNDTFKAIAKRIPLLGKMAPATQIGVLPLQLATERELTQAVTQEVLMRRTILDIGQGQKAQSLAALRELGTTKQIYGVNDLAMADIRLVRPLNDIDSLALGDIVQAPERYAFTHPQGLAYAKRAQGLTEDMYQLAIKEGVDVKKADLEPFQEFVHRVITGRVDADGILQTKRVGSRSVGGIVPSMRRRSFDSQLTGIEAGFRYGNNLETYVSSYIDDMFKAIADKRLADGMAEVVSRAEGLLPVDPLGRLQALYPGVEYNWTGVRKEMADASYMLGSIKAASRGGILSGATMAALRRRSPEFASRLDAAYALGESTFDKEIARFSTEMWTQLKITPTRFKELIQEVRGVKIDAAHPVRAGEIDSALRFINADALTSIRMLKQIYANTHLQRGTLLKGMVSDVQAQVDSLRPRFQQARHQRADRFAEVSSPRLGQHEGQIRTASGLPHPMFQNQIYPESIANQASKLLNDEANAFLKASAQISGSVVVLQASVDVSAGMIQGLIAHFAHPRQAFEGTIRMVDAFIRPGSFDRYIAARAPTMNDRMFYLGSTAPADFFESMGFLTRMAGKVPGGKWVVGQTYGRGQAAFSMWSTVYKDLMWDIGSDTWKKAGKGADFAKLLDRSVGQASFAQLGTPANLSAFLRGYVSFAPQYRLAVASYLASAFKGGMTGAMVRRDLAKAVAGATIMYEAWAEGTGNKAYLDPFRDGSKFMSIQIGDHWYGLGSAVISLIRMNADIAASALSIGENEPMDFLTFDKWQNPIIRSWLTQAAPLPGILLEAATQHDFLGYPLETISDWAGWAADKVSPISAQDILFDKSGVPQTPLSVLANVFGWRTRPETRWGNFDAQLRRLHVWDSIDDLTEEQLGKLLAGDKTVLSILNRFQKAKMFNALEKDHPEVAEKYADAVRDALLRGGAAYKNYTASIENIKDEVRDNLTSAIDVGVNIDGKDTLWLRDRASDIMTIYGAKNDVLREEPAYQELFAGWDESKEKRLPDAEMFDQAYWNYIENVVAPKFTLPNGDPDYDSFDAAISVFEQEYGREVHDKVRFVLENSKRDDGLEEWYIRLWKNKFTMRKAGYWDMPSKATSKFTQNDLDDGIVPADLIPTVQALLAADLADRKNGTYTKDALIEADDSLVADHRVELRKSNPELDAILGFWHYGGKVQSEAAVKLMVKWGEELGIPWAAMGGNLAPLDLVPYDLAYSALTTDRGRKQYRLQNPIWDNYLVENEGYTPIDAVAVSKMLPEELDKVGAEYDAIKTDEKYPYAATRDRLLFRASHPDFERFLVDVLDYDPIGDRAKKVIPPALDKTSVAYAKIVTDDANPYASTRDRLLFRAANPAWDKYLVGVLGYEPLGDRVKKLHPPALDKAADGYAAIVTDDKDPYDSTRNRLQFRQKNPTWDKYLVDVLGYEPLGDRVKKLRPKELDKAAAGYDAIETNKEDTYSSTRDRVRYRTANPKFDKYLVDVLGYEPLGDKFAKLRPEALDKNSVEYGDIETDKANTYASTRARLQYRAAHPAWDRYLVGKLGYKPLGDRVKKLRPASLDKNAAEYEALDNSAAEFNYRRAHPAWEKYLVEVLGYKPVGGRRGTTKPYGGTTAKEKAPTPVEVDEEPTPIARPKAKTTPTPPKGTPAPTPTPKKGPPRITIDLEK